MKQILSMMTVLALSSLTCFAETPASPNETLKTDAERLSYAIGLEIGTNLKKLPAEIDLTVFSQGVEHGFTGSSALITQQEALEIKKDFGKKLQDKRKELTEKNRKEEEAFLMENKKQNGVVTTESGLQYMVLHQGDGPKPKATDRVKVHYSGTLINGKEFDSSYKRDKPATFSLMRVVPGWAEGLQLMNVGSKYRLFIPSKLGYGPQGRPPRIGPNATLIFELELLGIEKTPVNQHPPIKSKVKNKE